MILMNGLLVFVQRIGRSRF